MTTATISTIIPFKNKANMTIDAVESLFKFGPDIHEILLVSNNSDTDELSIVKNFIDQSDKKSTLKLLEYNQPFNYQKINNWAVKQTSGDYVLFLNNDTELTEHSIGLLERMVEKASADDVGICGCLLLFGGGKTIQHAGVYLRPGGQAEHLYATEKYAQVLASTDRERYPYDISQDIPMTAVTGAVNIVERRKFDAVKGFDERFIICGGDVDLCLRLNSSGYQTWYVAGGYILHKESQSRKFTPIPYNDFYWSYLSYTKGFDEKKGDPFLSKVTQERYREKR